MYNVKTRKQYRKNEQPDQKYNTSIEKEEHGPYTSVNMK